MGRQAGVTVSQLLNGAAPASLHLPKSMPGTLNVDWRQLKRWGIAENEVASDTIVHFKEPTLWETHPYELVAAAIAFALLSGLVVVLLVERHRRRLAELTEVKHRSDAARAMRLALAGELSASIAHEINQPLGAILNNVVAADLMLDSGCDRRDELRAVLSDIRRDNQRASEVIRRLRTLFVRHEVESRPFKLDDAISDVANILLADAQRRGIVVKFQRCPAEIVVIGDRIEIGQVLINLAVNAMDAVADLSGDRRSILILAEKVGNRVVVSVRDHGRGVAPEQLPKLFGSFFTTKPGGLGLGLSITRTIVG
jgi:C4-dicarboxylate-specific signal transduction histidine kinase